MKQTSKITALYERLSHDDEQRQGDSYSIQNQKQILENYAAANGLGNLAHFTEMITSSLIQSHYKGAKLKTPKEHIFQAFFSIKNI